MNGYGTRVAGRAEDWWHRHHDTDENVANELAWALSTWGMFQAREGRLRDADEAFRLSVQFLEDRIDAGTAATQDIRDLPLLLSNYASFLVDNDDRGAALAVRRRAIDAHVRALRRPDNVDEDWVRASLLIDYAAAAIALGFHMEAQGAIEQAHAWLDLAEKRRPLTVAAFREQLAALSS